VINLYAVYPDTYEYQVFVFAESGNKAKMLMVNHFTNDEPYTMWRYKLLKKDVNKEYDGMVVECETDKAYEYVKELGFEYMVEGGMRNEVDGRTNTKV
jgi:hypothetical protein